MIALAVPTIRTLKKDPTQYWQHTKQHSDMPINRRMAWNPPEVVTIEMRKTGGANKSMMTAFPILGPTVSSTVPMKIRPNTAPRTVVTPDEEVWEGGEGGLSAYLPIEIMTMYLKVGLINPITRQAKLCFCEVEVVTDEG